LWEPISSGHKRRTTPIGWGWSHRSSGFTPLNPTGLYTYAC